MSNETSYEAVARLELELAQLHNQNTALENQVQSAERRLSEFKDAVMIVVRELARD